MKISKTGIDLIKSFEGCYLKAYRCPANILTIGYGHTGNVKEGQVITQAQAEELLVKDLSGHEKAVMTYVTYPKFNQNQFDALVSFAFNCGNGALKNSTLLKRLNTGLMQEASDQFELWNKGGGKVLAGLARRRAAEKKLFLTIPKDIELEKAVEKLVINDIIGNPSVWNSTNKINLKNVPSLLIKMGGVNKLISDRIITNGHIWTTGTYSEDNVRSLIVKYAVTLK